MSKTTERTSRRESMRPGPRARVERIGDSGHDLLADQPEETIRAVGEFLGELG